MADDKKGYLSDDEELQAIAERIAEIKARKKAEAEAGSGQGSVTETLKKESEEAEREASEAERAAEAARRAAEEASIEAEKAALRAQALRKTADEHEHQSISHGTASHETEPADDSKVSSAPEAGSGNSSGNGGGKGLKDPSRSGKKSSGKKEKSKRKKTSRMLIIAAIIIFIAAAGMIRYSLISEKIAIENHYYAAENRTLNGSGHEYTVSDDLTLAAYLKHPSLLPGDTIKIEGDIVLDIDTSFDGYLDASLVNFDTSSGSLCFSNGTVVLRSGRSDSVDLGGLTLDNCTLYIEAPKASVTWSGASGLESNIDAASLNGTENLNDLGLRAVGTKFTVQLTVTNSGSSASEACTLSLSSDGFIFADGDEISVESIPAGGSSTVDVSVIATQGGRHRITAVNSDGTTEVSGTSEYIDVLGTGTYTGDLHVLTSTDGSYPAAEEMAQAALDSGFSFMGSTGISDIGEAPDVSDIAGSTRFCILPAAELLSDSDDVLFLGYPEDRDLPSTNYGQWNGVYSTWTYQDAVTQGYSLGATAIITHPFTVGTIEEKIAEISSIINASGIEIVEPGLEYGSDAWTSGISAWDARNAGTSGRMFITGGSSASSASDVGSAFIGGNLTTVTERSVISLVNSGSYYASTGPRITFRLAGKEMGSTIEAVDGDTLSLAVGAVSDTPLVSITVLRVSTDESGNVVSEPVYTVDLSGKGLYSYSERTTLDAVPGSFYRMVVTAEASDGETSQEYACSNPIWVTEASDASSNASLLSVTYTSTAGSKDTTEVKVSCDGTYYLQCNGGMFTPDNLTVETSGKSYTIDYHLNSSSLFDDFVTVYITAEDGTSAYERIYIIQ